MHVFCVKVKSLSYVGVSLTYLFLGRRLSDLLLPLREWLFAAETK